MNFQIVELYFNDPYVGWVTKKPKEKDKSGVYEESYFIKVENSYFMLGNKQESIHVTDNDDRNIWR